VLAVQLVLESGMRLAGALDVSLDPTKEKATVAASDVTTVQSSGTASAAVLVAPMVLESGMRLAGPWDVPLDPAKEKEMVAASDVTTVQSSGTASGVESDVMLAALMDQKSGMRLAGAWDVLLDPVKVKEMVAASDVTTVEHSETASAAVLVAPMVLESGICLAGAWDVPLDPAKD